MTETVTRRTNRINPETIERVHQALRGVEVAIPRDPTVIRLRRLFSVIRDKRNRVTRILAGLFPSLGKLKAELAMIERRIEAMRAKIIHTHRMSLAKNAQERDAYIRANLQEEYEVRASLEEDLALLGEAVSHARLVLDELRSAYEEASRQLSSLDLEYRIEMQT